MKAAATAAVLFLSAALAPAGAVSAAGVYIEAPDLAERVATGALPPVEQRLPALPLRVAFDQPGMGPGRHGGELRMLASQPRDTRLMVVYGYARLVGYDAQWNLVPDILERIEVTEGRIFTFHLRPGHRWSDGHPFTAEDFRFYWQDVVNNAQLSPAGPDHFLLIDGQPPRFEVTGTTTVRFSWDKPNPFLLPALAGARPETLFMPAHYLRQFHAAYADKATLDRMIQAEGQRNWASLFTTKSNEYRNDNPDLPTLEPWQLSTKPPSSRFIFVRNPYFHRVDTSGRQLPYIDRIALTIASAGLLPAKTAAGESDLQARGLGFENYTVLKQAEKRNGYRVLLWKTARGSELALLPNLTCSDPAWRALFRNTDFRRALSLAVHRKEINKVIYYGLAREGNDTVLPASPMFEPEFETLYAAYDLDEANRLLDKTGLVARGTDGIRRLTDGRPLEIIVETAGEDPNQVAILQLIRDSWQKIGVKLFIKPEQRDVLRNRIFAGTTLMSVWTGLENALPTRKTSPQELAPTTQQQLYWSKWGQYIESGGHAGEAVDLAPAQELAQLNQAWATTIDTARQEEIWRRMLRIRAEQAFTIGTVRGVPQPVVVNTRLRNVPEQGVFNWEPGAQFGLYHPDSFWFDDGGDNTVR